MTDIVPETLLGPLHRQLQARMVPFAGYSMPVQYDGGIIAEHTHCRTQAGLFDVSHMGQIRVTGPDAARALESLIPVDIVGLKPGRQRYGFFTNDTGGLLDDLMVANVDGDYMLIVNAACKADDLAHLQQHIGKQCDVVSVPDRGLIALQGPCAAEVLSALNPTVANMRFMDVATVSLAGVDCVISRSGYTGEDGFELSIPNASLLDITQQLLDDSHVKPIGLGARDSLRLEAGLCLYGHDIDSNTSPIAANLTWALNKVRRPGGPRAGGYPGAALIEQQLDAGTAQVRVGIQPTGKAPVREGVELHFDGSIVGRITSGGYGPSVARPVAMGYVDQQLARLDQPLVAMVRNKARECHVCALPFSPHQYKRA